MGGGSAAPTCASVPEGVNNLLLQIGSSLSVIFGHPMVCFAGDAEMFSSTGWQRYQGWTCEKARSDEENEGEFCTITTCPSST